MSAEAGLRAHLLLPHRTQWLCDVRTCGSTESVAASGAGPSWLQPRRLRHARWGRRSACAGSCAAAGQDSAKCCKLGANALSSARCSSLPPAAQGSCSASTVGCLRCAWPGQRQQRQASGVCDGAWQHGWHMAHGTAGGRPLTSSWQTDAAQPGAAQGCACRPPAAARPAVGSAHAPALPAQRRGRPRLRDTQRPAASACCSRGCCCRSCCLLHLAAPAACCTWLLLRCTLRKPDRCTLCGMWDAMALTQTSTRLAAACALPLMLLVAG